MSIFFSIVIPIYKPSELLTSCIESIECQTFENYEVILVDHLDSISDMLHGEVVNRSKVSYVSISSPGVYSAMSAGIKLARGNWILFMGHDDLLFAPCTLALVKKHIEKLTKMPVALYGSCLINGDTGWAANGSIYDGRFTLAKLFKTNICQQAIFYDRNSLFRVGGLDDADGVTGDWKLNLKLSLIGELVYMPYVVSVFSAGGLSSNPCNTSSAFYPPLSYGSIYMLCRECGLGLLRSAILSLKISLLLLASRTIPSLAL